MAGRISTAMRCLISSSPPKLFSANKILTRFVLQQVRQITELYHWLVTLAGAICMRTFGRLPAFADETATQHLLDILTSSDNGEQSTNMACNDRLTEIGLHPHGWST
jgi:hypothetical protein